jgi:hypothetical protein
MEHPTDVICICNNFSLIALQILQEPLHSFWSRNLHYIIVQVYGWFNLFTIIYTFFPIHMRFENLTAVNVTYFVFLYYDVVF